MTIRTFSGTRDWHPSVLADTDAAGALNAEMIIDDIKNGRCPRCWGSLPTPPEFPAGSRITTCRSIPICGRCGSDEVHEALDGLSISTAASWPLPVEEIEARRKRHPQELAIAIPSDTGGWLLQYG
jgi:hypothetical protein